MPLPHARLQAFTAFAILSGALSIVAPGQCTNASSRSRASTHPSTIARYFLDPASAGYETGPLHVVYEDGADCVQPLAPLQKSSSQESVANVLGFAHVQLADDHRTLAWEVNVENCCTSYSIPTSVVVFRDKRVLQRFAQGQMVWSWMFVHGGDQIAIVYGTVHGPEVGDYRLYDVRTGRLLAEVSGDPEQQALKPDAPLWARQLEQRLHRR